MNDCIVAFTRLHRNLVFDIESGRSSQFLKISNNKRQCFR